MDENNDEHAWREGGTPLICACQLVFNVTEHSQRCIDAER